MRRHQSCYAKAVHELSVAQSLVELVEEQLRMMDATPRVRRVSVRLGALCGVDAAALRSAFSSAVVGTPLAGADLELIEQPVVVWCPQCRIERTLSRIGRLRCPACGTATPDIRAGTEMELESIEVVEECECSSPASSRFASRS